MTVLRPIFIRPAAATRTAVNLASLLADDAKNIQNFELASANRGQGTKGLALSSKSGACACETAGSRLKIPYSKIQRRSYAYTQRVSWGSMKSIISIGTAVALFATPSFAKSSAAVYKPAIWEFTGDVIRSSVKCELSRIAREVKGIPPKKATAKVTVKRETANEDLGKLSLDIPELLTKAFASREQTVIVGEEIELIYNISVENGVNCSKNNKFSAGTYDCLKPNSAMLRDKTDLSTSIKCKTQVDVKRVVSSETGLKVWVIDVGPSGSATEKAVYSFEVSVPAPSKK